MLRLFTHAIALQGRQTVATGAPKHAVTATGSGWSGEESKQTAPEPAAATAAPEGRGRSRRAAPPSLQPVPEDAVFGQVIGRKHAAMADSGSRICWFLMTMSLIVQLLSIQS